MNGVKAKVFFHWKNLVLVVTDFLEDDEYKERLMSLMLNRFEMNVMKMAFLLRQHETKKLAKCDALEKKLRKPNNMGKGVDLMMYINWLQLAFAWDCCMVPKPCCMEQGWKDGLEEIKNIDGPTDFLELKHRNLLGTGLHEFDTVKSCRSNVKRAKELYDKLEQASDDEKRQLMEWMQWTADEYEDALHREHINLTELYFNHYEIVDVNQSKVLSILIIQLKKILEHNLLDSMFMQWIFHATDISTKCITSALSFTTHHRFAQSAYMIRAAEFVRAKYENDPRALDMYSEVEWKTLKGMIKLIYVQHLANIILASTNSEHLQHNANFPKFEQLDVPEGNPKHENLLKTEKDFVQIYKECWKMFKQGKKLLNPNDPTILNAEVSTLTIKKICSKYLANVPDQP